MKDCKKRRDGFIDFLKKNNMPGVENFPTFDREDCSALYIAGPGKTDKKKFYVTQFIFCNNSNVVNIQVCACVDKKYDRNYLLELCNELNQRYDNAAFYVGEPENTDGYWLVSKTRTLEAGDNPYLMIISADRLMQQIAEKEFGLLDFDPEATKVFQGQK